MKNLITGMERANAWETLKNLSFLKGEQGEALKDHVAKIHIPEQKTKHWNRINDVKAKNSTAKPPMP